MRTRKEAQMLEYCACRRRRRAAAHFLAYFEQPTPFPHTPSVRCTFTTHFKKSAPLCSRVTNKRTLLRKLSHCYMFRHYRVTLRELVQYKNLHKTDVRHLNCKLYYRQLHLKYVCDLARYWLQAPWGWHDSVETCSSVIICEITVHWLVIVRNNKRCTGIEIIWNTL
jgi:hypothetical protein